MVSDHFGIGPIRFCEVLDVRGGIEYDAVFIDLIGSWGER